MAVTLGAMPVRMLVVLGWAWLALSIPGIPVVVFVLCLMWHWMLFAGPEVAMMVELSQSKQTHRAAVKQRERLRAKPVVTWKRRTALS
jgi:hypothetical protein